MSDGSLTPTELIALTLKMYSFSGIDHSLLHTVLQVLYWTRVDPHPLLCASLAHLNVVPGDGAAAVLLRGLPGNGKEVTAGSGDMQLNGRRWDT